jgi:LAO/AO transport system kinase
MLLTLFAMPAMAEAPQTPVTEGIPVKAHKLAPELVQAEAVKVTNMDEPAIYIVQFQWPMSLAMLAAFDIVLVETVGVGQKEIDVSKMTDTTCFVAQPASGDSIQFLKAGIMEIPHVIVVNKEDIGMAARKTLSELKTTLGRRTDADGWQAPALSASAALGSGIEALADALDSHRTWLLERGQFTARRQRCQAEWLIKHLREEFGRYGINQLGGEEALFADLAHAPRRSPIAAYDELRARVIPNP